MTETLTVHEQRSGLAESAILPHACYTSANSLDALARPSIVSAWVDRPMAWSGRIVIGKRPAEAIQASGPLPQAFEKSVQAAAELLKLPAAWNSYNAKKIAPENARETIQFLAVFIGPDTPQPAVVPRVQGGIQVEWHTANVDIEVYIDAPGKVRWFAENAETGETHEGPLAGHESELKAWVRRISGK